MSIPYAVCQSSGTYRKRESKPRTIFGMSQKNKTVQEVLWDNVSAIMQIHYGEENLNRFIKETKTGGTISRIKKMEQATGIEVLYKIATRYGLQPWHLILPGLNVTNPPVAVLSEEEKKEYDKLKKAKAIMDS